MLVKSFMTPTPITVDEDLSLIAAVELMKRNKVLRFPVMRSGKLVGIVTDRDLRSAGPSQVISFDEQERELLPDLHDLLSRIKIKDIMRRDLVTVTPEQTLVTAALLMTKHRISGLPVVGPGDKLVGILTRGDIFAALLNFTGARLGKTMFGVRLTDEPGSIKEVADLVRTHGARPASLLTSYEGEPEGFRLVYIRIRELPEDKLAALKKDLEQKFELLLFVENDVNVD